MPNNTTWHSIQYRTMQQLNTEISHSYNVMCWVCTTKCCGKYCVASWCPVSHHNVMWHITFRITLLCVVLSVMLNVMVHVLRTMHDTQYNAWQGDMTYHNATQHLTLYHANVMEWSSVILKFSVTKATTHNMQSDVWQCIITLDIILCKCRPVVVRVLVS